MNKRIVFFLLLVLPSFLACSAARELQNSPEIDASWQGLWQGQAILGNSLETPKFIQLRIDFTSTNIRAFYSDTTSGVRDVRVSRLKLEGDEIAFTVYYGEPPRLLTESEHQETGG